MNGTKEKSRLTLERRHQLIDLNKEFVNFDISFECRSVDATKDFEIIVVTQEQINTVDINNLTMKRTKGGYISGNIIADEDKYQNYFLILRSAGEEPVAVDLEIEIKPIEARTQPEPQPEPPQEFQLQPDTMTTHCEETPVKKPDRMVWVVLLVLVVAGVAGWYYYTRQDKKNDKCGGGEGDAHSVVSSSSHHSSSSSEEGGLLEALINKSKNKTKE